MYLRIVIKLEFMEGGGGRGRTMGEWGSGIFLCIWYMQIKMLCMYQKRNSQKACLSETLTIQLIGDDDIVKIAAIATTAVGGEGVVTTVKTFMKQK